MASEPAAASGTRAQSAARQECFVTCIAMNIGNLRCIRVLTELAAEHETAVDGGESLRTMKMK